MKKFSFQHIARLIFIVLFFILITAPIVNSITLKFDAPDLVGVENNYVLPTFSSEAYISGEYQQQFETTLSKGFYGYNAVVRTLNELQFKIFKKAGGGIVVCKDDSLIFQQYIDEYLGLSESYHCQADYIEMLTDQLNSITELAEKKGKKVIVVITPTKAEFIEEQIPDKYKNMKSYYSEEERGVHLLTRSLEEKGIKFVDGGSILRSQELPLNIFPSTGIHWTREAADVVLNKVLNIISENGLPTRNIEIVSREIQFEPRTDSLNHDDDLWLLMNILSAPNAVYSYPVEKVVEQEKYQVPNMFIQGDSFIWTFFDILTQNNIVGDCNALFYNTSLYDRNLNATPISDLNDPAIKEKVDEANIIMLEVNESMINNMGSGFYPVLAEILGGEDILDQTMKIEYESVGPTESQDGVTWRWGYSKRIAVKASGLNHEDDLEVSIWAPYSAYATHNSDIPSIIEIEVYLNGALYDKLPCSQDTIYNIQIPSDKLLSNKENIIEIVSPYSFVIDGREYSVQILYAGRIR